MTINKLFTSLILMCFCMSSCGLRTGRTDKAVINLGHSTNLSRAEVQAAADCVIQHFRDSFKGCELIQLLYDESKSNAGVASYFSYGKGRVNGVKEDNVIILHSDFKVDFMGGDESLNPNSTYRDYSWILIRDSKSGKWKYDDSGY